MNLYAATQALQNLSDQQLQQLLRNPNAPVPRDYVMFEIQRRQQMRTHGKPVDTTPVVQEQAQQAALAQGIAGTPQMSGNASFKGGGIVSFDDGGSVDSPDDGYWQQRWNELKAAGNQVGGWLRKQTQNDPAPVDPAAAEAARTGAPLVSTSGVGSSAPAPAPAPAPAAQPQPDWMAMYGQGTAVPYTPISMPNIPPSKVPDIYIPPDPVKPDKPTMQTPDDYLAQVNKENPDVYGDILSRTDQRLADTSKLSDQAKALALMSAGAGMLSAHGPNALSDIGQGLQQGLGTYMQQNRDVLAQKRALEMHRDEMAAAQGAAKQGNYRLAAQLAEQANSRASQMYQSDMYGYRFDKMDQINQRNEMVRAAQANNMYNLETAKLGAEVAIANGRNQILAGRGAGSGGIANPMLRVATQVNNQYDRDRTAYLNAHKGDSLMGGSADDLMQKADAYAMSNVDPRYRSLLMRNPTPAAATKSPDYKLNLDGTIK